MKFGRAVFVFFFFSLTFFQLFATHQRAGEISYTHISDLTYEFKLVTYTYTPSPADRPDLEVFWGDGSSTVIPRNSKVNLPNDISVNTYIARHTFPSSGYYSITMEDPNRNAGIVNIPNSVNIPFFLETTLLINPFLGPNSSPQLLNPPIDNGCVNQIYYHNPGAYDVDGDSLSYRLISCRGYNGEVIPGYSLPFASQSISIDPISGDLIWDSPTMQGEYNIAIQIQEWRNGVLICEMIRDMQVIITACDNQPPSIDVVEDTCIVAGTTLELEVQASDPNSTQVTLSATGSPFRQTISPAQFPPISGVPPVSSQFTWNSDCQHVRRLPYQVTFKAIDNGPQVNLVAYKTLFITVIAPKIENLSATPLGNNIILSWSPNVCSNAKGYLIYKRISSYSFVPDYCETGLPASAGYQLIGRTTDHLDTTFLDDGSLFPSNHGNEYCYRIVAFFEDGAESYVSDEVCTALLNDVPLITHVDVLSTDPTDGTIFVQWNNPTEADLTPYAQFEYRLFRSTSFSPTQFLHITTTVSLSDTSFVDSNLNTTALSYTYRVELWGKNGNDWEFISTSDPATSIYLSIEIMSNALALSWAEMVPWNNLIYTVYRYNSETSIFDSIGNTTEPNFIDRYLENGSNYCYFVRAKGGYFVPDTLFPLFNRSQIKCAIPLDIDPPEVPKVIFTTDCETVTMEWEFSTDSSHYDAYRYFIHYKPSYNSPFIEIDSFLHDGNDCYYSPCTYYITQMPYITGCFAISVEDTVGNRSNLSEVTCFDTDVCMPYSLPNVFTPDGDGVNDYFIPFPYENVQSVNFSVYDRWGRQVFYTKDPDINWDGKNMNSKQKCPDGVYFYVCEVFLNTLQGIVPTYLNGSITLIRKR